MGAAAGLLVPASWSRLPRGDVATNRRDEPLDVLGGLFLAAAISGGLLGVTEGARNGPTAPSVLAAGAVALGGMVALVVRQRRVPFPFIPRELIVSAGSFPGRELDHRLYVGEQSPGVIIGVPLLLARVNGLSAAEIGLWLVPNALLTAILGVLVGRG